MDPFGLEGRLTSEVRYIKGTCHLLCFDLARKEVKEERTDLIESQLFGFAVCVCAEVIGTEQLRTKGCCGEQEMVLELIVVHQVGCQHFTYYGIAV